MNGSKELTIHTVGEREVVLKRAFEAPRTMVYRALTTPDLLRRWYAPPGWSHEVCEIDLRVGGRWRHVLRKPDGKAIGQRGEYQELVPDARIVASESWDDWDPGATLVTTVLEERGETTTLTSTMVFPSKEVRDVVLKNGLEHGARDTYDQLARVLAA